MLLSLDYCTDMEIYTRINKNIYYRHSDLPYKMNHERYKAIDDILSSMSSFGLLYFAIYSLDKINPRIYKEILYQLKSIPDTAKYILCDLDMDNRVYRERLIYYVVLDINYIKDRKIKTIDLVDAYRSLATGLIKSRRGQYQIDLNIARNSLGEPLEIDSSTIDLAMYYVSDLARVYLDYPDYFRIIKNEK